MRANTLTAASAMIQKMRHGMVFIFHPARRQGTRGAPMHDESWQAFSEFECEPHDERSHSDGGSEGAIAWRSWSGPRASARAQRSAGGARARWSLNGALVGTARGVAGPVAAMGARRPSWNAAAAVNGAASGRCFVASPASRTGLT